MMTALAQEAPRSAVGVVSTSSHRVTLPHLIRSEMIKLTSLRSPWWSAAIVIVISLGITGLYSMTMVDYLEGTTANDAYSNGVLMSTMFTVLLASIIGTMLVTGEYSTGMIRSTLTAAPDRLRSLIAKVIVAAVFIFIVAAVTFLAALAIATAFFAPNGVQLDLSDAGTGIWPYVNGAVYLALIGVMGVGIGYIIRNGAGAISVIVAITFILPMIPGFIAMVPGTEWIHDAARFLPTNAGVEFMLGAPEVRLHGGLVLAGWALITTVLGAIVLKRRDA